MRRKGTSGVFPDKMKTAMDKCRKHGVVFIFENIHALGRMSRESIVIGCEID